MQCRSAKRCLSVAYARQQYKKKRLKYEDGTCLLELNFEEKNRCTVHIKDTNGKIIKKDVGSKVLETWAGVSIGDTVQLGNIIIEVGEEESREQNHGDANDVCNGNNLALPGASKIGFQRQPFNKRGAMPLISRKQPSLGKENRGKPNSKRPGFVVPKAAKVGSNEKFSRKRQRFTSLLPKNQQKDAAPEEKEGKPVSDQKAGLISNITVQKSAIQLPSNPTNLKNDLVSTSTRKANGMSVQVSCKKQAQGAADQSPEKHEDSSCEEFPCARSHQLTQQKRKFVVQESDSEDDFLSSSGMISQSHPIQQRNKVDEKPRNNLAQFLPELEVDCDSDSSDVSTGPCIPPPDLNATHSLKGPKDSGIKYDGSLMRKLRPHQTHAVKYLCKCLTGNGGFQGYGAILADEMGLGKTLTSITVCYSLLQSEYKDTKKAVVVCPSSLVKNWSNEIRKWKGFSGKPHIVNGGGQLAAEQVETFRIGSPTGFKVLIISYEMYRSYATKINSTKGLGLIIADEGHRLKNSESQVMIALSKCPAKRRLILTGTPIQNDLQEFYEMVNFVNPGLLGSPQEFRSHYMNPINACRDKHTESDQMEVGEQRLIELASVASKFVLRRTQNSILKVHLPPKSETVVFCRPSTEQSLLYERYIQCSEVSSLLGTLNDEQEAPSCETGMVLPLICNLRKVCNHPALLDGISPDDQDHMRLNVDRDESFSVNDSGKIQVLESLLSKLHARTNDKVVLVSNFTSTLNIFEKLAKMRRWTFRRLDGSTSSTERQHLVDCFNGVIGGDHIFLFLLSAKAGGVGLNLIGANRLVMFDPDWNPSVDEQAMARIWRDGQKKSVFIYRFLTTGTIEEKIFQRQLSKLELASVMKQDSSKASAGGKKFSTDELREIFSFNPYTKCDTYEKMESNISWPEYISPNNIADVFLKEVATELQDVISFVHSKEVN